MRRIKYLVLTIIAASFTLQSCSEDKMDDINKDQNNPSDVESKYIVTDMMVKSAFTITGSDLAFYTSVYTELLGGGHNQMFNAQVRRGEPILASTYNNSWNSIYSTLRNLNIIIEKCSPGGKEEGNLHVLGMAQVLKAYNLAILTDLFGDVPYSKAFNISNSIAELDKQEDIYKEIFALLDTGIENLEATSTFPSIGAQDVIYGGNASAWAKTAYGLKARYKMRLSKVQPNYQEVIDLVAKSFTSSASEFVMQQAKVPYPFFTFAGDRNALFSSQTFYNVMEANDPEDPRLKTYFVPKMIPDPVTKDPVPTLVLIDPADKDLTESQTVYSPSGVSNNADPSNKSNAIYLLSMHELKFLEAEAYARLGNSDKAIEALEEGIKLGLNKRQALTDPNYEYPSQEGLSGAALIKKIAQSKYISFFEVEAIEAYNDIRRWKAMGEELIPLRFYDPKLFPLRLAYGQSDVVSNKFVQEAYGDGRYVYTENVWWAGGTR